jgi:hypothetical protein
MYLALILVAGVLSVGCMGIKGVLMKNKAVAMHDKHLKKVKGYVKNDIKEDKELLKENEKINKALHREKGCK